jgi:hypothetical protein
MMVDPKAQPPGDPPERGPKTDQGADADNNLGRGAPADREERLQQIARDKARSIDDDPQYQNRKAHDLDREDCEINREGIAGKKPSVRISKEEAEAIDKG